MAIHDVFIFKFGTQRDPKFLFWVKLKKFWNLWSGAMRIDLIGRLEVMQIQTREPIKNHAQNFNTYNPMNGAYLEVETAPCKPSYTDGVAL